MASLFTAPLSRSFRFRSAAATATRRWSRTRRQPHRSSNGCPPATIRLRGFNRRDRRHANQRRNLRFPRSVFSTIQNVGGVMFAVDSDDVKRSGVVVKKKRITDVKVKDVVSRTVLVAEALHDVAAQIRDGNRLGDVRKGRSRSDASLIETMKWLMVGIMAPPRRARASAFGSGSVKTPSRGHFAQLRGHCT